MSGSRAWHWRWIEREDDFEALGPVWCELHAANPEHSAFQSWEWSAAWWRHFGSGKQLAILVGEDKRRRVVAIAPLCVAAERLFGQHGFRRWQFIGADSAACSDHLGLLVVPEADAELYRGLLEELWSRVGARDAIVLTDFDQASMLPDTIAAWAARHGIRCERRPGPTCPVVSLPDSWSAYLAGLSRNFRSQIRQSQRRVAGEPALRYERLESPRAALGAVKDLVRLSELRLQEKGIESSLRDPAMAGFLEEVVPAQIASERAWLDVLREGGETVAVALHLLDRRTVAFYQGGFDPRIAALRPMTVLFARVIERAINNGYRVFDFLRGQEEYKYRWGAAAQQSLNVSLYPAPWSFMLRQGARQGARAVNLLRRMVLGRAGG